MSPFWTVTLFWIAAAVAVLVAMAFLLPALVRNRVTEAKAARRDINIAVYRDQLKELQADRDNDLLSEAQFEIAKVELEARLAEDALAQEAEAEAAPAHSRKLGFALAGLLPIGAFGLYFLLGNPDTMAAVAEARANPAVAVNTVPGEHDILQMIQKVEEKTKTNPNDAEAWTMLAKTYAAMERWPEALTAYEKAMQLKPDVASVMTGYAEALAIVNNRTLQGKPMELVLKALEIDPDDMKGLELAGIHAFQERSYAKAAFYFKHLHKLLPPDSPYAQDIHAAQQEAKRLSEAGLTGMDNLSDQGPATAQEKASPGATVKGKVDIAPALKAKVSETDVVFLFARSATGGAPVAAIRATAKKFPLEFELSDAMAMSPDNKLSNFKEVSLTARIVKSGDIKGAAGDLEGNLKVVKVGAKDVKLVIDTVRQ